MNPDEALIDLIDLVNFTLSDKFLNKWQYRFSRKFLTLFQLKLLESFSAKKPLSKASLTTFFVIKHKYHHKQVENLYEAIDISLYSPLISR